MLKPMIATAALLLCAALPAQAQDFGGVRLRNQASVLDQVEAVDRSGCPLSKTSVTVGVNRATGTGSQANQQLATGSGGCRPLVSTQVAAGVNLAVGNRSGAQQSIQSTAPSGLLATTTYARGINIAAGRNSSAGQGILAQSTR